MELLKGGLDAEWDGERVLLREFQFQHFRNFPAYIVFYHTSSTRDSSHTKVSEQIAKVHAYMLPIGRSNAVVLPDSGIMQPTPTTR